MYQLQVYFILVSSPILVTQTQNLFEETVRLKTDLFTNHSVDTRPVKTDHIAVSLDVNVNVHDVYLHGSVLHSRVSLKISWLDDILQWQSENYKNISHLHLKETSLWTPKFHVRDSASDASFECYDNVVKLYNDGKVHFGCLSIVKVRCETTFVQFPFDDHQCEILLYVSDYDTDEVQIEATAIKRPKSQDHQSKRWRIKNLQIRPSEFHPSSSAAISVTLQLKRNFLFHLTFALFPVILVSLLVPLTFLIQDNAVKVLYSLQVFLVMILLVFQILPHLPKTCNCAFNLYIGCLLLLNFLSIIISVAMYKYHHRDPGLQETKISADESSLQDFVYDFRNPHNFLFYEKMLKKLTNQRRFTCCSTSVDDVLSAEMQTYFKSKANKRKYSNLKMFVLFGLIWSTLTILYFMKIFQII